jgi:16S rRNA (guanine527-N7)-methyltransferase
MEAASAELEAGLSDLAHRYGLRGDAAASLLVLAQRLTGDERAPTSAAAAKQALDLHVADSLVALEIDGFGRARTAADLGSGAGLPGLVLAAALPDLDVRLVEARQSKCAYIADLIAAMALPNARVVCDRAEAWHDGLGRHDLVVARALAAQPVVLEYAAPLLAEGGRLVEWRGGRDTAEEGRAERAARELGLRRTEVRAVEPFAGAHSRHLHVYEKVKETSSRFPRRPGIAARRPLGG